MFLLETVQKISESQLNWETLDKTVHAIMSLILRKDPLIEAVCEFHLDAPDWDWTVPGVVYGRIKDRFGEKREAPHVNFQVEQTAEGINPSVQTSVGRMQFHNRDKRQLVQVGPQHFSVHQFKPYGGWPDFKALIEEVLTDYQSVAPFKAIRAMSLRYTNQIQLPAANIKFEHILRAMPQIPDSGDQIWTSWFQQVEILKPELEATLSVRSGYFPPTHPSEPPLPLGNLPAQFVMFDLLFAHVGGQPIEQASVFSWLETAHNEIEKLFFDSMVKEYLTLFEPEVKPDDAT